MFDSHETSWVESKQQVIKLMLAHGVSTANKDLSVAAICAEVLAKAGNTLKNSMLVAQREANVLTARRATSLRLGAKAAGLRLRRKRPAQVEVLLTRKPPYPAVKVPRFTTFDVNGKSFFNRHDLAWAEGQVEMGGKNSGLFLYAGEVYTQSIVLPASETFTFVETPFGKFTVSDIDVYVTVNNTLWYATDKAVFMHKGTDQVFLEDTNAHGYAVIVFGNDLHMKRPKPTDLVRLIYVVTQGSADNSPTSQLPVRCPTEPTWQGETTSSVYGGQDELDASLYSVLAPTFARSGGLASTGKEHNAALSDFPNVADVRVLGQSDLIALNPDKYAHPAYMNIVNVVVLPMTGDALPPADMERFMQTALSKSKVARDVISDFAVEPVPISLHFELYCYAWASLSAISHTTEMAVRKMFERKVGMLGKHFTESDWQRAVPSKDEGVDYAVVPKVEVELKPYQYAVLKDLVIKPFYTKRQ